MSLSCRMECLSYLNQSAIFVGSSSAPQHTALYAFVASFLAALELELGLARADPLFKDRVNRSPEPIAFFNVVKLFQFIDRHSYTAGRS